MDHRVPKGYQDQEDLQALYKYFQPSDRQLLDLQAIPETSANPVNRVNLVWMAKTVQ